VNEPRLLEGGLHVDDRGELGFINPFDFRGIKRFYTISNHSHGTVRAWHGHKIESKYFFAVNGALLVCCVAVDDWENPSKDLPIHRFVLSDHRPAVLHIPAGYANGLMSLTEASKAVVFSTATLEESASDDVRFPARFWDPWSVQER
jgi:dTDP-4-dehydrorhamnose 3,5-epimerase-like enzyme